MTNYYDKNFRQNININYKYFILKLTDMINCNNTKNSFKFNILIRII